MLYFIYDKFKNEIEVRYIFIVFIIQEVKVGGLLIWVIEILFFYFKRKYVGIVFILSFVFFMNQLIFIFVNLFILVKKVVIDGLLGGQVLLDCDSSIE